MNRERMKQLLPVMKAFAEGKDVQSKLRGAKEWQSADYPVWHADREYRIKPDPPRVLYVIEAVTNGVLYHVGRKEEKALELLAAWNAKGIKYTLVEYVEKVDA